MLDTKTRMEFSRDEIMNELVYATLQCDIGAYSEIFEIDGWYNPRECNPSSYEIYPYFTSRQLLRVQEAFELQIRYIENYANGNKELWYVTPDGFDIWMSYSAELGLYKITIGLTLWDIVRTEV